MAQAFAPAGDLLFLPKKKKAKSLGLALQLLGNRRNAQQSPAELVAMELPLVAPWLLRQSSVL
jgi:hypothetical protein